MNQPDSRIAVAVDALPAGVTPLQAANDELDAAARLVES